MLYLNNSFLGNSIQLDLKLMLILYRKKKKGNHTIKLYKIYFKKAVQKLNKL